MQETYTLLRKRCSRKVKELCSNRRAEYNQAVLCLNAEPKARSESAGFSRQDALWEGQWGTALAVLVPKQLQLETLSSQETVSPVFALKPSSITQCVPLGHQ